MSFWQSFAMFQKLAILEICHFLKNLPFSQKFAFLTKFGIFAETFIFSRARQILKRFKVLPTRPGSYHQRKRSAPRTLEGHE